MLLHVAHLSANNLITWSCMRVSPLAFKFITESTCLAIDVNACEFEARDRQKVEKSWLFFFHWDQHLTCSVKFVLSCSNLPCQHLSGKCKLNSKSIQQFSTVVNFCLNCFQQTGMCTWWWPLSWFSDMLFAGSPSLLLIASTRAFRNVHIEFFLLRNKTIDGHVLVASCWEVQNSQTVFIPLCARNVIYITCRHCLQTRGRTTPLGYFYCIS